MNKLEILCDLYKKVDKNYNSDKNSIIGKTVINCLVKISASTMN